MYMATCTLSVVEVEALESCCRILGIQLSPEQEAAVTSIFKRRDVFVSLPTGAGKYLLRHTSPAVQLTPSGRLRARL